MTDDDRDRQLGRACRELRQKECDLAHVQEKLVQLHSQIEAVLRDWNRLDIVNGRQLVSRDPNTGVVPEFRPLPTEPEIVETLTEAKDLPKQIETLRERVRSLGG